MMAVSLVKQLCSVYDISTSTLVIAFCIVYTVTITTILAITTACYYALSKSMKDSSKDIYYCATATEEI